MRVFQSHCRALVVSSTPSLRGFEITTLVVIAIGTDCTGSCKSIYHTITTKKVGHLEERLVNMGRKGWKFSMEYGSLSKNTYFSVITQLKDKYQPN
jgi:hypothetical protein